MSLFQVSIFPIVLFLPFPVPKRVCDHSMQVGSKAPETKIHSLQKPLRFGIGTKKIRSGLPKPQFLLSKAPPMNAAAFAKLAAGNALFQAAAGILRRGEAPLLPGGLLQGAQKMTVGENKMSALDMNDGVE